MRSYAGIAKGETVMVTIEHHTLDDMVEKILLEQISTHPEGIEMDMLFEAAEEKDPKVLIKGRVRDTIWRLIGKGRVEVTVENLVKPVQS
jgi:hypothetical protein